MKHCLKKNFILGVISDKLEIIKWAKSRSIPTFLNLEEFLRSKKKNCDFLVSIVNSEILSPEVLAFPQRFAINFHDSLLPRYSGVNASSWSILNNEKKHGVSWHIADTGLDKGAILKQAEIPISSNETSFTLNFKCYEKAHELFSVLIDELDDNLFKARKQDLSLRTYYRRYQKPPGDGFIDWHQPADEIERYCRALNFGHYNNSFATAKVILKENLFIIPSIILTQDISIHPPGVIISTGKQGIKVSTGSLDILITKLCSVFRKNYSVNQLIKSFQVHKNAFFRVFSQEELKSIQKLGKKIAEHEAFWCQQLLSIQDFPQLPSLPKFQEPGFIQSEIPINIPKKDELLSNIQFFSSQLLKDIDLLMAVWLVYLNLINPFLENGYTLGYKVQGKNLFNEYLVNYIPLTINLNSTFTLGNAFLHVFACLEQIAKHETFKKDIYARYNDLFKNHEQWPLENIPIALVITDSITNYILDPMVSIAIVLNEAGDQCKIVHAVKTNDSEKILWLNQIAEHISGIFWAMSSLSQEELINTTLSDLNFLFEKENQILMDWSFQYSQNCFFPDDCLLSQFFEKQSSQQPHSSATTFNGVTLTYIELNERANQLAHYLQKQGVTSEEKVVVSLQAGIDYIVAVLAILKCHAVYVPISFNTPISRIKKIMVDSGAKRIITKREKEAIFFNRYLKNFVLCIDNLEKELKEESKENLKLLSSVKAACIIYTSGSTGDPKGVIISHLAIISRVKNTNYVSIKNSDKVAQIANLAFDAALFEIWGALINGAELKIFLKETVLKPKKLSKSLKEEEISVMFMTASLFNQTLRLAPKAFDGVKQLLCGGEAFDPDMAKKFLKRKKQLKLSTKLINAYGPTETTIFAITHEITDQDFCLTTIPIGKPINHAYVLIVDQAQKLMPIGVIGEIYIGGIGLAEGYVHQALTDDRFIKINFFGEELTVYKTGDFARWLPNGVVEYIGRRDQQVKIRGFRIELNEIKNCIQQYDGIEHVVIVVKKDSANNNFLAAYLVSRNKIVPEKIRHFVELHLPDYMVPSVFVRISKIPFTENGKLDYKKLPKIKPELLNENKYVNASNPEQEILQKIWCHVLNLPRVGIFDNFFLLGGHSLHAAHISAQLFERYNIRVSIADISQNPTVASLAKRINYLRMHQLVDNVEPLISLQKNELIPVTSFQKKMWILQTLEPENHSYNIFRLHHLKGNLKLESFTKAVYSIIERHEILRFNFYENKNDVYAKIKTLDNCNKVIEIIDAENLSNLAINDCIYKNIMKPFDLTKDHLFKTIIYKIKNNYYLVLFCFHHIIFDGTSFHYFYQELSQFYNGFLKQKLDYLLPPLKIQFSDFAIWQKKILDAPILKKEELYWKRKLSNLRNLNLPTDYERPSLQSFRGKVLRFSIPKDLSKQLIILSKSINSSLFSIMMATFSILIFRYSHHEDFAIGLPVANRVHPALKNMLGPFINTVAIRCDLSKNPTFLEYLNRLQTNVFMAINYSNYPFEEVMDEIELKYDPKYSRIFQVIYSFIQSEENTFHLNEVYISSNPIDSNTSKTDLGLEINVKKGHITGMLEYNIDLFSDNSMNYFISNYITLLESVIIDPKLSIKQLRLIDKQELDQFDALNNTFMDLPWQKNCYELFSEQVKRSPFNVALRFNHQSLSYQELSQQVFQLANYLQEMGVSKGESVVLSLYRSIEMIVAILAIFKLGAIYVPLDPDFPEIRQEYILNDCNANYLLTSSTLKSKFLKIKTSIILLDDPTLYTSKQIFNRETSIDISPEDIAYIIYTSGTTNKPKGVMCTHKGLSNRLLWMQNTFLLTDRDVVLQKTTFCFDVSLWEFLWPIITGAILVLALPHMHKDPDYLLKTIIQEKVTTLHFVPSMLHGFLNYPGICKANEVLTRVMASGEELTLQLKDFFFQKLPQVKLYNLYGPTEAAIDVSYWDCTEKSNYYKLPIGKPIANIQLYVLDEYMQHVPYNVAGELYIGGIGVARGYVNNKEMTSEKFINNPFSIDKEEKLYKTGDLVKLLPNGNFVFLDRLDNQIKLRGFRIELSEIEHALLKSPLIEQCVVLLDKQYQNPQLIAYLVVRKIYQDKITANQLKKFLLDILPEYCLPSQYICINELPLTDSGKIDSDSLAKTKGVILNYERKYEVPQGKKSLEIAKLWKKILKLNNNFELSIFDNFFELGGTSISALNLLSEINKKFNTDINIRELLGAATIKELVLLIESKIKIFTEYKNLDQLLISDQKKEKTSCIIPISINSSKPPLFLFHPIDGTLFWCLSLIPYLSKKYSIYAIEDPGLRDENLNFSDLEELTYFYVKEILKLQTEGNYLFAGFSSGATLAIGAAKQLAKLGKNIDFLGVIDGWAVYPKDIFEYDYFKLNMKRKFEINYHMFSPANYYNWEKIWALQWRRLSIYEKYMLPKIYQKITLFKAKDLLPIYQKIEHPFNHWDKYSIQPIEVHIILGDHESILQEPYAENLANQILKSIAC